MVICLDLLLPPFREPEESIRWIRLSQEKHLELDELIGQEKPLRSKEDLIKGHRGLFGGGVATGGWNAA